MKLQVLADGEGISGYNTVYLKKNYIDLANIADNECEDIILQDNLFSKLSYDDATKLLVGIAAKLRRGGTLRFTGVDLRMLSRGILYGQITEEDANQIFATNNFLISANALTKILHKLELQIDTLKINGIKYEFSITR